MTYEIVDSRSGEVVDIANSHDEAAARIRELEQQLVVASERERKARAEADHYLAYIYRGVFEDERERGEFEDDAIRIANNIIASLRQTALAAASEKGAAPASDGEQPEGGREEQ